MELFKSDEEELIGVISNINIFKYKEIEIVKSILENSNKNKKILKLNKKNKDGWYPLLGAISKNNIEIVNS